MNEPAKAHARQQRTKSEGDPLLPLACSELGPETRSTGPQTSPKDRATGYLTSGNTGPPSPPANKQLEPISPAPDSDLGFAAPGKQFRQLNSAVEQKMGPSGAGASLSLQRAAWGYKTAGHRLCSHQDHASDNGDVNHRPWL